MIFKGILLTCTIRKAKEILKNYLENNAENLHADAGLTSRVKRVNLFLVYSVIRS